MNPNEKVSPKEVIITETGDRIDQYGNTTTVDLTTPTTHKSKGFFSTKRGKIILFSVIGIVIVAAIIGIVIASKKKDSESEPDPVPCQDPSCNNNPVPPVRESIYKKNDIYVYEETITKESNIELNDNVDVSGRRLENNVLSQKSTIKSKYVFNIYDEKDGTYYAYVAVIDMNKKIENKESKTMGGKNITEMNNVDDTTPVAKLIFKEGEIIEFYINEKMNETLVSYLYEFVEKIISKKEGKENNEGKIIIDRPAPDNDDESKEGYHWEITLENGKAKRVEGKKDFSLTINNEKQITSNSIDSNFTEDIEIDTHGNRDSFIKQIINNSTSTISLYDDLNNEETTNKLLDLLKNVNFVKYNNNGRRLEIIPRQLNNLRNLETSDIDTYAMPLHFNYPLFKSNLLGAKIGLIASVIFTPMEGKFYMKIIFDVNGNSSIIYSDIQRTNFNDVIDKIGEITRKVYNIIAREDTSILPIFDEYEQKIKSHLSELENDITYQPKLITDSFDNELNRILTTIREATANCYNNAHENTTITTQLYDELLIKIKDGEEDYTRSIKAVSSSAIASFLSTNKNNLDSLFNKWKTFYDEVIPELKLKQELMKTDKSFNVDVGLYYDIKDQMKSILYIYKNFVDNLLKTLNIEETKFRVEAENKFEELVVPTLIETEVIAENANNNISVIDAMREFYKTENGDSIRLNMVRQINNFRITIKAIMEEIFTQISKIYSEQTNSSNEYLTMVNDIKIKYEIIDSQQVEILNELRIFNKYDINFDIYFEDIKLLNDLEIEVNNGKKESYKKNIGDYLISHSDNFLIESEMTDITNTIKTFFNGLKDDVINLHWTEAETKSNRFISIVKELNDKYLNEKLGERVVNYYTNTTFLTTMFNNYYNDVTKVYNKFNTSFFDVNYINHRPLYVSKPTELINKLLDITYSLNPDNSLLHRTVQELIISKIRLGISTTTRQIYEIIVEQYNTFIQATLSSNCCINGYDFAYIKKIKEILETFKNIYFDERGRFISIYLYNPSGKEDEFNLKSIIRPKEDTIRNNIRKIVDQINIDFHDIFCYGDDIVCVFENVVSQIEHYYYQASKLRVSLSFIQSLVSISETMIGDNILSDLNSTDYSILFKYELNYKGTEIITDITAFLTELNKETLEYINGSIETFKTNIKSYFSSGINLEGISENIKTIAQEIFVDKKYYIQEIHNYLYDPCGPISKIMLAFDEEINFHKVISENKFLFDSVSYKQAFDETYKKILDEYSNQKKELFKDWELPKAMKTKLYNNIINFIHESSEVIFEKINSLTEITQFEFLNMTFSIREITSEVLNEVTDDLISKIDNTIETNYNQSLNNLISLIKVHLDEQFETIKQKINSEYEGTFNYYNNHYEQMNRNITLSGTLVTFQQITSYQLIRVVSLFFKKVNLVYSNIDETLELEQDKSLKEHYFKFIYQDFSSQIEEDIYKIYRLSYERLIIEKNKFQAQIKIFYKTAFRNIITQFIYGKGREYLTYSVESDYENNIYHDFRLMNSAINQTYYTVMTLLDGAELKGLGYKLVKTFVETFPNVSTKVNANIPKKIENVIYPKIELFKKEIKEKIVKLYVNSLESETGKIKSRLSSKVYELVPKQLDAPFKGLLESIFNENITESIQEMKDTYYTKINEDLQQVLKSLEKYGNEISKAVSLTKIDKMDPRWDLVLDSYETLNSAYTKYNKNYVFEVVSEKNEYITTFFNNKITPYLKKITVGFNEQVEIGQRQLEEVLEYFKVGSLVNSTILEITNSQMKANIITTKSLLKQEIVNLQNALIEKLKVFPETFKKKVEDIDFEGFDYKNKSLRNLEDYNLYEIEDAFNLIEEKYNNLKQNILTDKAYYGIISKKEGFIITLTNSASTLTNDFYAYKVLIEQYTDNTKIDTYFTYLESDAEVIRNKTFNFVFDSSNEIDSSLNIVYSGMKDSWLVVRNETNQYIYTALDKVFKEKLHVLTESVYTNELNKIDHKLNLLTIEVVDSNREILNTIDIHVQIVNGYCGYSLKRLNDYDFTLDVYAGSDITLTTDTYIDNRIVETMSGKLASGKAGIKANYTLHDMSLDIDAYAKLDKVNYVVNAKTIDEWQNVLYNTPVEVPERNVTIKKKVRTRFYEI